MDDFILTTVPEEEPDGGVFEGKMPWDERARRIREIYPSTARLDWEAAFRVDPLVMSRVITDIQKLESASSGRPGKRPAVNAEDAAQYMSRYQNEDYTILEFKDAFSGLKGLRSNQSMARKCGLSKAMVQRLLSGSARPSAEIMEDVARAFKKHPSFFVEYRIAFVVAAMTYRMEAIPESSIVPYLKLRGDAEKDWK